MPDVSVVVSNFNGAKYLPRLLESLSTQRDVTLEIIVVDRHSRDESAAILAAHPDVSVLSEPPESGLVSGYAVGAEAASANLLFFCNEDMWFDPNCLAQLVTRIRSAADIGAVDPWQWTYDETTLIHAGTRFVQTSMYQNGPDPSRMPDFVVPLAPGDVIPFGCAGAVLVRRGAYDAVGGWDRSFFLDVEDLDLFIRFWQTGWRVVVEPAARVYHAVGMSNAQVIAGTVPVSRRRYISSRASVLVMAVKYLPWTSVASVAALWFAASMRRVLLLRWKHVGWDVSAAREVWSRLSNALLYRRSHAQANRQRPVREFFRGREFQR